MNIYTTNAYIKDMFGEKLYKLSLNAGTTCPNRDGKAGTGGCIFCSEKGSGDFSEDASVDIDEQIEMAKKRIAGKCRCDRYIAYFQSFTNTYGNIDVLREKFLKAARRDDIAAVSIASRPDCFGDEVVLMLKELSDIKPVWVELGLQTIRDDTAKLINRGYDLNIYDDTMEKLKKLKVHIITHMIIGLPGENMEDAVRTVRYIIDSGSDGIKLQLLHILKGTVLEQMYMRGEVKALSFEEYADILMACLKEIPENVVVHRFTGDGPKRLLAAPLWSADKKRVINELNRRIREL